ncbi:MAG: hypothetical protein ACOYB1_12400 [Limnohabitans sp.]
MSNPPEEFVKLVSSDLIAGRRFTPAIRDQFTPIIKRAFDQLISEKINARLKDAMTPETAPVVVLTPVEAPADTAAEAQVSTSLEELEAYHTIRAILRESVSPRRIYIRDAQSYCAILLDDNNRKPICRLRFNNLQKLRLGLFNDKKEEEQVSLEVVDDVFNFADRLRDTLASYLQVQDTPDKE